MAVEIERKFLVADGSWSDGSEGMKIAQGYLTKDPERTVRVRLGGEGAWITIKGKGEGISRSEFEYPIPQEEARELLGLCLPSVIEKVRHRVRFGNHWWEVDVFHGANEGLVVAEIELTDPGETFDLPPWAGKEVSEDPRFFNSRLADVPFRSWE